jgi:hypothetical protein
VAGTEMFQAGKWYTIHMDEGTGVGYSDWKIESIEMPLIKISNGHTADRIVNTASPVFAYAELSPHTR